MPSLEPLRPEPSVPPLRQSETPEHVEQPAVAAPRPIGPGTVLRSRYVLEREIGSGGMGTVYRALDRNRLGLPEEIRCIAVKVLHPELAARPDALQTLRQEFYQAQSLSHPGIVNVFDFDQDAHVHFMTMELLDGELLGDLLVRIQPNRLRRDVALRLLRDLGVAVAYAHEHGVLHRDLKPGNVMVSRQGEIRVLDFGLGRFQLNEPWISESGMSFDAITPTYASTERLSGKYPDSRDDLFSFACVAYEILAGRHPFARKSATDAREVGLKPRRIKGLTGRQWRTLKQGLAWSRDDRPGTMHEMLDGLGLREQIDAGATRPDTAWRRNAATAITALVAIAALGFAGWTLYQQRDQLASLLPESTTVPATPSSPSAPSTLQGATTGVAVPADATSGTATAEGAPAVADTTATGTTATGTAAAGTSPTDTPPAATAGAGTAAAAVTGAGTAPAAGAGVAPAPGSSAAESSASATQPVSATAAPASSAPGKLGFTVSNLPVSESAATARLTVRRTGGSAGTVSFAWRTVDDSAVGGTDFAPASGVRETMGPGQTTATVLIPLVGDSVREPTRLFDVVIDDFTGGAARGAITRATVVIVDDD